jgi:KAP family P-loop domain
MLPVSSNDYWTLDLERLGMQAAGEGLARLILTCQPPYAVCVQGKWGSGKTSLMRYAMARVGGEQLGTAVKTVNTPPRSCPSSWRGSGARSRAGRTPSSRDPQAQLPVDDHETLRQRTSIVPIWFNPWQQQDLEMPVVALLDELRSQYLKPRRSTNGGDG